MTDVPNGEQRTHPDNLTGADIADEPSPAGILALPMQQPNNANAATIRDYLITLLANLWEEGSDFSSKRPFGYSSWGFDLYVPLVKAGIVQGTFDEDGCLDDIDRAAMKTADRLIADAIQSLGATSRDEPAVGRPTGCCCSRGLRRRPVALGVEVERG